jgi:RND superfamily putative drug exporter
MVLVPATMSLLGRWNWWVPAWLDRVLPGVRAEITDAELGELAPVSPHDPAPSDERQPVGAR